MAFEPGLVLGGGVYRRTHVQRGARKQQNDELILSLARPRTRSATVVHVSSDFPVTPRSGANAARHACYASQFRKDSYSCVQALST
eukprot:2922972-Amphidinium_carterae.1